MATLSELLVKISGDSSGFVSSIGSANDALKKAFANVDNQTAGFRRLGDEMAAVGRNLTLAVTAPMVGFGIATLQAAGQMEQASTAFKTLMGSTDAAAKHMAELRKFALETPFQFTELVDASRRMQALGFSAAEVVPRLRTIGNAVSALGLGADGINRVVLALGQMRAKGTAQAEEMRQLAEAGIPAWDALAKRLGVTIPQAMKLVEERAVSSRVAIEAVLSSMDQKFGGGMEAQAKTLLGLWSNVKDAINFTFADIGNVLAPSAKRIIKEFIQPTLDGMKDLAKRFSEMSPTTQNMILGFAGIVTIAPPVILALGGITKAAASLAAVVSASSFVSALRFFTSPVGLAVGGAIAVAATGKLAWDEYMKSLDATKKAAYGLAAVNIEVASGVAKVATAQKDANKGQDDYEAGIQKLIKTKQRDMDLGVATVQRLKALGEEYDAAKVFVENYYYTNEKNRIALQQVSQVLLGVRQNVSLATEAWMAQLPSLEKTLAAVNAIMDSAERIKSLPDAPISITQYAPAPAIPANDPGTLAMKAYSDAIENTVEKLKTLRDAQAIAANAGDDSAWLRITEEIYRLEPAVDTSTGGMKEYAKAIEETTTKLDDLYQALGIAAQAGNAAAYEKIKTSINSIEGKKVSRAMQEVSTIFNDLGRNIADCIVNFKGFGEMGVKVAKEVASTFLRLLIQGAMGSLYKLITGTTSSLGTLTSIFKGGGAAADAVKTATGVVGDVGKSASNTVGSLASKATGSITGIVGAVGSAVSAVSGIIGNFQMKGMNKSLDVLVRHTLQLVMQGEAMSAFLRPQLGQIHDRLVEMLRMFNGTGGSAPSAVAIGGGGTVNFTVQLGAGYYGTDAALIDLTTRIFDLARRMGLKP
jgi:tape measure domain-containing protein